MSWDLKLELDPEQRTEPKSDCLDTRRATSMWARIAASIAAPPSTGRWTWM